MNPSDPMKCPDGKACMWGGVGGCFGDCALDGLRVGKYFADYSELTPEEIARVDEECAELIRRSK